MEEWSLTKTAMPFLVFGCAGCSYEYGRENQALYAITAAVCTLQIIAITFFSRRWE